MLGFLACGMSQVIGKNGSRCGHSILTANVCAFHRLLTSDYDPE
jgi:hypothetical protein